MAKIEVDVRLRPVRFAFLVRPEDRAKTLEAFRVATCLWGGKFNPIVPFFKRIPTWWERHGHRFERAEQIVNGYLEWFEPDFVVETRKGLASGLDFAKDRILQLSDVLADAEQHDRKGTGQDVYDLYVELYKKHFQFERRIKQDVISVRAADARMGLFAACIFGDFPRKTELTYFAHAFKDAFDPVTLQLDAASYERAMKGQQLSALRLGHERIEVAYHGWHERALFILDATEPKDLIDFWNLRAIRRDVVAIPKQWLPAMSAFCKSFIKQNYRPMRDNPNGVMHHAVAMFSRSIPESEIDSLYKKFLMTDVPEANFMSPWYPSIWRPSPSFTARSTRPTLTAKEATENFETPTEGGSLSFATLSPEFASRYGGEDRWANVVRFRDWSFEGQLATTYPTDFRNPLPRTFQFGVEAPHSTTEGFIVLPRFKDLRTHWRLQEGSAAIAKWLAEKKIASQNSEAGRSTEQIIKTLGGPGSVRLIACREVIQVLNDMAKGSMTMQVDKFKHLVEQAQRKSIWLKGDYEQLVKQRVVELGMELSCQKCGSWSWYSISQLDYRLNCELCLKSFEFPKLDTSQRRWAFRVVGPFALRDFAAGGYAGSLAIRFFANVLAQPDRAAVEWAAGKELTVPSGRRIEVDFTLWYQPKAFLENDFPTEIVVGEAKSYGRWITAGRREEVFKAKDVARMQELALALPGAILVFATLKDGAELSANEVSRLKKLAEWGRKYEREHRRTRAPVIVLTGTELFTPHHLEEVWKQKGGLHAQFVKGHLNTSDLRRLADMTQQLYLGMEPYHTRWEKPRRLDQARSGSKRAA